MWEWRRRKLGRAGAFKVPADWVALGEGEALSLITPGRSVEWTPPPGFAGLTPVRPTPRAALQFGRSTRLALPLARQRPTAR